MNVNDLLFDKRDKIVGEWLKRIFHSYPEDTSRFLRKEKDRFNNPVGYTFRTEIPKLYQEFISDMDQKNLVSILTEIIKIRAVQEYTPSQALSFITLLKDIIHNEIDHSELTDHASADNRKFDDRIDTILLTALNIYVDLKKRIFDVKINEMRNSTAKLIERMNSITGAIDMDEGT